MRFDYNYAPSGNDDLDEEFFLEELLKDGWQPIGATNAPRGWMVHLIKMILTEDCMD